MSPTFADLGVPRDLAAVLSDRGVTAPFPIQSATIPDALAGRDICGRAPTGSGKTIAFGVPLVAALGRKERGPRALVLVPTRELCAQVAGELEPLARARGASVVAVYGGVSDRPQRRALSRGAAVVVACPGRLEDLLAQRALTLDLVDHVVIDEADRMADMGFLPAVQRILDRTAAGRQTQLFSATLGGPVATLTRRYQVDPVRHEVGGPEDHVLHTANHEFRRVERSARTGVTAEVIRGAGSTVVFCRTRHGATRLTRQLARAGVAAAELHGGRSQSQRDRALAAFADGRVQALVATDVAARGIHVDDVACVVHYDLPADADTYVHRSGRTARAGASGSVVTLVDEASTKAAKQLQRSLDIAPSTEQAASSSDGRGRASDGRGPSADRPARSSGGRSRVSDGRGRASGGPARASDGPARSPRHRSAASRPRKESRQPGGRVKFFDARRGFGFIARDGADDLFVHHSNVAGDGAPALATGDRVEFRVGPGRRGDEAFDVRPLP